MSKHEVDSSEIDQSSIDEPNSRFSRGALRRFGRSATAAVAAAGAVALPGGGTIASGAERSSADSPPSAFDLLRYREYFVPPEVELLPPEDIIYKSSQQCDTDLSKKAFTKFTVDVNNHDPRRVTVKVWREPQGISTRINYSGRGEPAYFNNMACGALVKTRQAVELRGKNGSILGTKKLPGSDARVSLPARPSYFVKDMTSSEPGDPNPPQSVDTVHLRTSKRVSKRDIRSGRLKVGLKSQDLLRDPNYWVYSSFRGTEDDTYGKWLDHSRGGGNGYTYMTTQALRKFKRTTHRAHNITILDGFKK